MLKCEATSTLQQTLHLTRLRACCNGWTTSEAYKLEVPLEADLFLQEFAGKMVLMILRLDIISSMQTFDGEQYYNGREVILGTALDFTLTSPSTQSHHQDYTSHDSQLQDVGSPAMRSAY